MEKIIELNRRFIPNYIYVDEGFGYTQIEMLKKFAIDKFGKVPQDHPDLNLANIVGINFSSSISVKDPYTNETRSKATKQFMVENSVSMFEKGMISLDIERDGKLEEELLNYIEKSRTPSGRIIYATSNAKVGDHTLDAFMLGLHALHMETDSIINTAVSAVLAVPLSPQVPEGKRNIEQTGTDSLAYFSDPIKTLHYRDIHGRHELNRPYRGKRTDALSFNNRFLI